MTSLVTFVERYFGRIFALVMLAIAAPTLLLVALLLRSSTDEPVLLADDLVTSDGAKVRSYRFRTAGRGSPVFRTVGRVLRAFSFDEFPGLWAIVRGQISLGQFLALGRRK